MPIDPRNLSETAILTFSDEFDAFRAWDGISGWDTKWSYAPPEGTRGYNQELQWYINEGYRPTDHINPWIVRDGVLHITAARADREIKPHIGGAEFTSGMINTFHSFSQTYGYFEMRASVSAGKGLWPALWMLPTADRSQEIDIVEVLGHQPTVLHNAVHSYATGPISSVANQTRVPDASAGFHTYGLHWAPDRLTYYFDGRAVFSTPTPADMHERMFLIVNLAVGGTWPGNPNAETPFPASFKIDYVRAYAPRPEDDPSGNVHPLLSISAVAAAKPEGTGGEKLLTFVVSRTGDQSGVSTVQYAVVGWARNGTDAADFSDGVLPSGVARFEPGETAKLVTVRVAGDDRVEPDEGFTIDLYGPSTGSLLRNGSASGNVFNDDVERSPEPGPAPPAAPTTGPRGGLFDMPTRGLQNGLANAGCPKGVGMTETGEGYSDPVSVSAVEPAGVVTALIVAMACRFLGNFLS